MSRRSVSASSLGTGSLVVEVASNDGYLLQHFVGRGVPVLGVEPARNVADAARERGVPTVSVFLGRESGQALASAHGVADLVVGNNVFAHVPDLHDFTAGLAALLSPTGVLTLEFPHLVRLMGGNQFDTIYHEHFSYFSFHTATQSPRLPRPRRVRCRGASKPRRLAPALRPARGRSRQAVTDAVGGSREKERKAGVTSIAYYDAFRTQVEETKRALLRF